MSRLPRRRRRRRRLVRLAQQSKLLRAISARSSANIWVLVPRHPKPKSIKPPGAVLSGGAKNKIVKKKNLLSIPVAYKFILHLFLVSHKCFLFRSDGPLHVCDCVVCVCLCSAQHFLLSDILFFFFLSFFKHVLSCVAHCAGVTQICGTGFLESCGEPVKGRRGCRQHKMCSSSSLAAERVSAWWSRK